MSVVGEFSVEMIKVILSMTFTGSIISLFLFILKPVVKDKLPKSFQYYMWISVVIALMLPISKIIVIPVSDSSVMPIKNEQIISQITHSSDTAVNLFVFWQIGMILVLGFHILCYVLYVRRLRKHNISADRQEAELLNDLLKGKGALQLYKNLILETPILIGFFRPAVILPDKKYEDVQLRNILMHEITHRKKQDIFVKWLLIFVGAVHWFNPMIYFVRREMNQACELACDESVIKRFDISEMQQYGNTLIAVAADSIRRTPFSVTMFEDKKILKERLAAIMKHKKYSKRTVVTASIILTIIVCGILGFSTLSGVGNGQKSSSYADNYLLPSDQKRIKEIELKKSLRDYYKNKITEAYVFLSDSDDVITDAYITVVGKEEKPDSEMQRGIQSLASEELKLDVESIYVDYIDFESFTSNQIDE